MRSYFDDEKKMANGNGNNNGTMGTGLQVWRIVVASGLTIASGLLINLTVDVRHAMKTAENHTEIIIQLHGELDTVRQDIRERTSERYTSSQARRDLEGIDRRIDRIEDFDAEHVKEYHRGDGGVQ
jgi:predicted short-subunit dehydrogenase-like oxidoreductase (DUF2520 family)